MDLTFISLLRVFQNESCPVQIEQPQCCIQHASPPSAAIERGCSIGANCAQNCQRTIPDPATRVAIARFRIIRARFNKRFAQVFLKGGSNIRNAPLPTSSINETRCVCPEAAALPRRRTINEDAFALDDCSRLRYRLGIYGPRTFRL
jgi:hypothetical protein